MEQYKGREPYIFISYARRDSDWAKPLLEALSSAGYRVWYDVGIQAGDRWTETLVEKVEGCAVFCPLFSEAFNVSRYCFEETEYAYRNDKMIIPIYLEELNPDGLRPLYRLLQARQAVRLYKYADAAQFVERLGREEAFAPCKAPEWNKVGQIQWRLSADGVLTIARNEDMPDFIRFGSIPPYQYDPIYECSAAPWAPYREKILSAEIADDIDAIGDRAFEGYYSLENVRIPHSVTKIGDHAFSNCYRLTDVRIPYSVTGIGDFVFAHCESLTHVSIPNSVTKIGDHAFESCKSLTNVCIPDSVTEIGNYAFTHCENLTNVRIPDSVIEIGNGAFWNCISLKSVTIPSVTNVGKYAFPYYVRVMRYAASVGLRRNITPPPRRHKRYATPRRSHKDKKGQ